MNMYTARWENAKKKCAKINKLLKAGYLIFDGEGEKITNATIVDEYQFNANNCFYFVNDKTLDNGMYDTIKEFNQSFQNWVYIHPKHIKKGI